MDPSETVPGPEQAAEQPPVPLPPLPKRIVQVFVSPGEVSKALARTPVWGWALLLLAVLGAVQFALIPIEVWNDMMRESAIEQGQELPEWMGSVTRGFQVFGAPVVILLYMLVKASVVSILFAFILGDEGKFRQYLSVVTHSQFIPITIGLLLVPLRISAQDPQLTLNMGTFFFFFDQGYLAKVLKMLDLSQIWAWLVVAQGAHAIDPARSVKSATVTVLIWAGLMALLFGLLPVPGM